MSSTGVPWGVGIWGSLGGVMTVGGASVPAMERLVVSGVDGSGGAAAEGASGMGVSGWEVCGRDWLEAGTDWLADGELGCDGVACA